MSDLNKKKHHVTKIEPHMHVTQSDAPARTEKESCEDQNLARAVNNFRLNLGPIISAPAAKGNFFFLDQTSKLPPLMGVMETHSRHTSPQLGVYVLCPTF